MAFAAAEAKDFNVVIALNVEANGIEIGQGFSFLIFFPVVGVAAEQDVGARGIVRDVEGAEDGHFFLGRMSGEDGDLIEETLEAGDGCGKGDDGDVR
jgi:hypothetical protein